MRAIRYIGRFRNAGYGHSLTYRMQMECALYVPFGYLFAPSSKKREWESEYEQTKDEYDDTGNDRLMREIEVYERLCAIESERGF